nr:MAG TPA: hypothetical protein [Caudoviricetes sp.]
MNAMITFLMIFLPGLAVYAAFRALRLTGRILGFLAGRAARLVQHQLVMRPQSRYFVG